MDNFNHPIFQCRFRFRLPVFAPFGTEGFTLSPEQERERQRRDEDDNQKDREEKGVEKDFWLYINRDLCNTQQS